MTARRPFNPFYPLLVAAGVLFTVTATAYGVMAFTDVRGGLPDPAEGGLLVALDRHGLKLLAAELLVLAIATVGAIASDREPEVEPESSATSPAPPHDDRPT